MANLYELMGEYARLQEACYGEESVPDHETIEAILTQLEETGGALRDKVDSICAVLRNLSSDIEALEAEEARLRKHRTAITNAETRLREWVRSSMDVMGVDKIKTPRNTVYLSDGVPSVVVIDEAQVPAPFATTKTTVSVNKRGILANYRETGEIPSGVDIVPGPRKLTIR